MGSLFENVGSLFERMGPIFQRLALFFLYHSMGWVKDKLLNKNNNPLFTTKTAPVILLPVVN